MERANTDIEIAILQAGLLKWQVADKLGIEDATFSRWLRKPFSEDKKEMVLNSIKALQEESKC
jgi:hypothetical protein